jgi:protein-S-isoprenylcysteine O-methyltransferase Ste14
LRPPHDRQGAAWRGVALTVFAAAAAILAPAALAAVVFRTGWSDVGVGGWTFVGVMAATTALETFVSAGIRPDPPGTAGSGAATLLAIMTGFILLALSVVALGPVAAPVSAVALAVGGGLAVAGMTLRAWSIHRLGPRFRSDGLAPAEAALERNGPYRLLAHPSEVGLLALGVGGLILVPTPVFAGLLAGLFALQTWRLYLEENALFSRYGAVYPDYRRGTFDPLPSVFLFVGGRRQ